MYNKSMFCVISAIVILFANQFAIAETKIDDKSLLMDAMKDLSASTLVDGAGPDSYASLMAEDYTRWTVGDSVIQNKSGWIDGIKGWYTEGWRVKSRKVDNLELKIVDGFGFARKIVEETYVGPEGDESISKSALAETWVKRDGQWLLFQVNVTVVNN